MEETMTPSSSQGAFAPEPRVYELGYLIMPTVDEGNIEEKRDALMALITQFQGITIDEGKPVLIDLAYDMEVMISNKKNIFSQGYFGWIKFDMSPTVLEALQKEVESTDFLIRFLLIKTVRENTVTSDQPFRVAQTGTRASVSDEDVITQGDDFTVVEGIGPVIDEALHHAGIQSYAELADSSESELEGIVKGIAGNHPVGTWTEQAALAAAEKWDDLDALKERLNRGVEVDTPEESVEIDTEKEDE